MQLKGTRISARTWLKQPCATFLDGWNNLQTLDTILLGYVVSPSQAKKTNTNTGHWHVKETLTQKIQWCRMFSPQKDVKFHSVSGGSL